MKTIYFIELRLTMTFKHLILMTNIWLAAVLN